MNERRRWRFAHRLGGRLKGIAYLWSGRTPDPDVPDDVLADRVRSEIGPLCKRLDVPHLNVMSEDHVVLLHGAAPTLADARSIETAVSHVSGVRGVESYVHIGLGEGSTRPSEGRAAHRGPSEALTRMLDAAKRIGVPAGFEKQAVRVVASVIAGRIPSDEREQLLAHLPSDVRALAEPPRRHGASPRIRTVDALATSITTRSGLGHEKSTDLLLAVMSVLKEVVPEEAHDVAAALPADLRVAWETV